MHRKSFWPPFFLNLLLWTGWFYLIVQFPPEKFYLIILFFLIFFLALGVTLALALRNNTQGFLLSGALAILLLLRFLKMDNILNLILLLSLFLTLELYLRR